MACMFNNGLLTNANVIINKLIYIYLFIINIIYIYYMPLPEFDIIKLNQLNKYKNYEKYDDYLKEEHPHFYAELTNPQIMEIADTAIEERMRDAIRFFASKGVGD
jgi:hypothetical protein